MRSIANATLIAAITACAYSAPGALDRREVQVAEARKSEACARALAALVPEAERASYTRTRRSAESVAARQALTDLEVALANAPANGPLDRAARRFTTAAEVMLLRARERVRLSSTAHDETQSASFQSILATYHLFRESAGQLQFQVAQSLLSRRVVETTQLGEH